MNRIVGWTGLLLILGAPAVLAKERVDAHGIAVEVTQEELSTGPVCSFNLDNRSSSPMTRFELELPPKAVEQTPQQRRGWAMRMGMAPDECRPLATIAPEWRVQCGGTDATTLVIAPKLPGKMLGPGQRLTFELRLPARVGSAFCADLTWQATIRELPMLPEQAALRLSAGALVRSRNEVATSIEVRNAGDLHTLFDLNVTHGDDDSPAGFSLVATDAQGKRLVFRTRTQLAPNDTPLLVPLPPGAAMRLPMAWAIEPALPRGTYQVVVEYLRPRPLTRERRIFESWIGQLSSSSAELVIP